jgi:hypothetical protein
MADIGIKARIAELQEEMAQQAEAMRAPRPAGLWPSW